MKLKILFFTVFILFSLKSFSCVCPIKYDFKTKEDLNEYDFIAHVKVTSIDIIKNINRNEMHQISFEIKELYKGKQLTTMLIYGSNQLLGGWTSCDLGEMIGDEWIIFATTNLQFNQVTTGQCSRSIRIKDRYGYEDISYSPQSKIKQQLELLFDKVTTQIHVEGKYLTSFPNENLQSEQYYSSKKLNGPRKLWYPNKVLESTQYYDKGMREGVFKWYSEKGELTKIEKFKNNIQIDTTIIWRETDTSYISQKIYSDLNNVSMVEAKQILSKRQIWIERVYNKEGNILSQITYDQEGMKEKQVSYDPKLKTETVVYYHKNGTASSEMHTKNNIETGVYREWFENGRLKRIWEYDEKGIVKKETVKRFQID